MAFFCEICNKKYKTYQTLWKHNKLKHSDMILNIKQNNKDCKFSCDRCNKKFRRNANLKYHKQNTCKNKLINNDNDNNNDDNNNNNNNNNNININDLQNEIIKLKNKVNNMSNNNIIPANNNITTNNNNNNNLVNNGTVNNIIYINKTGSENVLELNESEINEIFNKEVSGIVSFIKFINFNERLPNNHSFCAKSLEGKYLLSYNIEEEKIESVRKKYFYQELLNNSVEKMELLYSTCYKICKAYFIIKSIIDIIRIFGKNSNMSDKSCKNTFPKNKQTKIENTIQSLKEIKDRDLSNKVQFKFF